jgi:hypothetical protein
VALYAKELSHRLRGRDIAANSFGVIADNLIRQSDVRDANAYQASFTV